MNNAGYGTIFVVGFYFCKITYFTHTYTHTHNQKHVLQLLTGDYLSMVKKGPFSCTTCLPFAPRPWHRQRPRAHLGPLLAWAHSYFELIIKFSSSSRCALARCFQAHASEFRNSRCFQAFIAVTLDEGLLSPFCGSDDSSGNWTESLISSGFVNGIFIGTWALDFWDVKHAVPLSRELSWTIKDVIYGSNGSLCGDHAHRWSSWSTVPSRNIPCVGGPTQHTKQLPEEPSASSVKFHFRTATYRAAKK